MAGLFFYRPVPSVLRLAALAVLSATVSFYSLHHSGLRIVGLSIARPVLWVNGEIRSGWAAVERYAQDMADLQRENKKLRKRILSLEKQNLSLPVLRSEDRQLLALLDSFPTPPGKVAVAQVVAQRLAPGSQAITVNLGNLQGVYVGQPVLAAGGVAGQVTETSPANARVALLSDRGSSIPVHPKGSGLPLLVVGTGNPQSLKIPFQPRNTPLRKGVVLVSSGLGGRFPPGLPVGTVTAVRRPVTSSFADIRVKPAASLETLDTVLLLWPPTRTRP